MEYLLGKLVCGLKKGEKSLRPTKNVRQKVKWILSRMGWQKILDRILFLFSIVEFLNKNCGEKLHRQSVEKIPKWLLAGTKPTYDKKGKKQKCFVRLPGGASYLRIVLWTHMCPQTRLGNAYIPLTMWTQSDTPWPTYRVVKLRHSAFIWWY